MPLRTGDRAPQFTLPTQRGRPVTLRDACAAGPVVLIFEGTVKAARHRLGELREARPAWHERGATLLVVLADRPERVKRHIEETGLPFNVLVDPDAAVHERYGLIGRDLTWMPGLRRLLRVRVTAFVLNDDTAITGVFEPAHGSWGCRLDDLTRALESSAS
jgi:thioredoxin-dependent peroxiredoxin